MINLIKKEKKNVFLLSLLLFLVGVLIVSTMQIPLLAGSAVCSDGECSCSCSGTACFCNTADNACECYCYPYDFEYCNNNGKGGPEYPG